MEAVDGVLDSIGLDEIVECRLRELIRRVSDGSAADIEPELTSLAKLIDSYNRKEELLENLLDPLTTADKRKQLREALKIEQRNRVELEVIRAKSRELLDISLYLFLESSRKVYRHQNGPEYSPELCGYCRGFGTSNGTKCPACHGNRLVVVHQPAMACPRCKGSGKTSPVDIVEVDNDCCIVCRGKGWAFTRRSRLSPLD